MDPNTIIKVAGAIAAVLVLIFIAIAVFRRIGGEVRGKRGSRLAVTEFQEVDKLRHLVLVRRDNEEHLLLIGGPQDVVIETNIGAGADVYQDPAPAHRGSQGRRQDAGIPAPAGPKLPPPPQAEYDEYDDSPPPLRAPARR